MRYSLTAFLVVVFTILFATQVFAGIATTAETKVIMEGDSSFIVENAGETVIAEPILFSCEIGNIDYTESAFHFKKDENTGLQTITEKGYGEQVILYCDAVLATHSEAYSVDGERLHITGQALVSRPFSAYNTKLSGRRKADTVHRLRT